MYGIKKGFPNYRKAFFNSVRPLGFEPKTYGLENRCSIQLSYGRILRQKYENIPKTQTKENNLWFFIQELSLVPEAESINPLASFEPSQ